MLAEAKRRSEGNSKTFQVVFSDRAATQAIMLFKGGRPYGSREARALSTMHFGHWNTQTFIAALRHDRLDAPWVIDGAMNRELFELYVETQLAPTLRPGEVIILDNLASHKSPKAAATMNAVGAWFLFLPPYSPDLNPIEMAFAKLKALNRRAAARTYDAL